MSETATMTLTEFLLARLAEDEADLPTLAHFATQALRQIFARHDGIDSGGGCASCGEPSPCEHLRLLALPFADHDDYREEWRP